MWRPARGKPRNPAASGTISVCDGNLLVQVHVPKAQWGQTNRKGGVWSRERFIEGPWKELGDSWSKKTLSSPEGFGKAFSKARWGSGRQATWGNRVLSPGFTWSVLRKPRLCAHGHQVVNILSWWGFSICKTTQETCIKYCCLGPSERS